MIMDSQLFLTNGENEELEEKAIYFLRVAPPGKNLNLNEIDGDFIFGEISSNSLQSVSFIINNVFSPIISEKCDSKYWQSCDKQLIKDFLNSMN